jgi:hypothetical protein
MSEIEPMDAWVDYAKRSGLLDESGVAPDRAKAQTAWFAYTAAWNECARQAVEAERERCARLCEKLYYPCPECAAHNEHEQCDYPKSDYYAAAIRKGD